MTTIGGSPNGLLLEPVDIEKYEFIRLDTREKWVVLMRPDDELAKKETVRAKDLSELSVILAWQQDRR